MRRVYKHKIEINGDIQIIDVHGHDAKVVSVGMQNGDLCVWIEQDPAKPKVGWCFRVHGTGRDITDDAFEWCGTVHAPPYVWHVYSH